MSKLVYGIMRIIPRIEEKIANHQNRLVIDTFLEAYLQLREACPEGDLRIHLAVEVNRPEDAGVKKDA